MVSEQEINYCVRLFDELIEETKWSLGFGFYRERWKWKWKWTAKKGVLRMCVTVDIL